MSDSHRRNMASIYLDAAERGDVRQGQFAVNRGVDIRVSNEKGRTAAHLACRHGHCLFFVYLKDIGAPLLVPDRKGRMPWELGKTADLRLLFRELTYPEGSAPVQPVPRERSGTFSANTLTRAMKHRFLSLRLTRSPGDTPVLPDYEEEPLEAAASFPVPRPSTRLAPLTYRMPIPTDLFVLPEDATLIEDGGAILELPGWTKIDENAIRYGCKIGTGGTADVFIVTLDTTDIGSRLDTLIQSRLHAVGCTEIVAKSWAAKKNNFEHEVMVHELLSKSNHPNITPLLAWSWKEVVLGGTLGGTLIMPYFPDGDLRRGIHLGTLSSEMDMLSVIRQVGSGIALIHTHGIAHRDIKASNILLTLNRDAPPGRRYQARITDMGLARVPNSLNKTGISLVNLQGLSYRYAPPEAFMRWRHQGSEETTIEVDIAGDIYSYGMLMWEVLHGKDVWDGMNITSVQQALFMGRRPDFRDTPSASIVCNLKTIINNCWDDVPVKRPPINAILQSLFSLITNTIH